MISPTGTASSAKAPMKSIGRVCPSRRWNHQAIISGVAIFSNSLGWMTMPTLSQRVAPLRVMPKNSTPSNSTTPSTYSGTARLISRCGGTCATTNRMPSAISMLRPWSAKRVPWSKPDEYMAVKPMPASTSTATSSSRSNPRSSGQTRCQSEGLSNTMAIGRIIPWGLCQTLPAMTNVRALASA